MRNGGRPPVQIRQFYRALSRSWGPQHWWPADSAFEVILGAFLTQNTAWTNVERALENLRNAGALSLVAMREMPLAELERLLRPSGYFRQKAQRVKGFIAFLDTRYEGSLEVMFARPTSELREELLALKGVGPETADSILLYAGDHPVFVVDAYTRRIVERHEILPADSDYETIRAAFEQALSPAALPHFPSPPESQAFINPGEGAAHPPSRMSARQRTPAAQAYNEMHALIVGIGKRYCRKAAPDCRECPLGSFLPNRSAEPGERRKNAKLRSCRE